MTRQFPPAWPVPIFGICTIRTPAVPEPVACIVQCRVERSVLDTRPNRLAVTLLCNQAHYVPVVALHANHVDGTQSRCLRVLALPRCVVVVGVRVLKP